VPSLLASVSYPGGFNDVAVADFNKDGVPDIVSTIYSSNTVSVLLANGDGTFGAAKNAAASASHLTLGDFNGDGRVDVVGTNSNGLTVLLGKGDGTFLAPQKVSVPKGQTPEFMAAGDLNGDGLLDLVVAGDKAKSTGRGPGGGQGGGSDASYLTVLLGKGDGTFRTTTNFLVSAGGPSAVTLGDFTGDGKPDVVLSGYFVYLLLGNGDGTLQPATTIRMGTGPLAVGDLNGDGKLDVITVSPYTGIPVNIVLGNGDGSFQPVEYYHLDPAAGGPFQVALGDFNGDGKLDIVTANLQGSTVSVLLGNGDGTFQAARSFATGPEPNAVAVGDFNGDGWLDLAVTDGSVWVLLNDGHW
jgi:hypothetical protein